MSVVLARGHGGRGFSVSPVATARSQGSVVAVSGRGCGVGQGVLAAGDDQVSNVQPRSEGPGWSLAVPGGSVGVPHPDDSYWREETWALLSALGEGTLFFLSRLL